MKKKVTFIIPSINRKTLTRSINSLINQTNENWECIIVYDDVDGPTFDDPRIKTIKTNSKLGALSDGNHGVSGIVRNVGIEMCDTEWIAFLDDDDTIHKDYVKTLYEKYSEYDFVVWRMLFNNGAVTPSSTAKVGFRFGHVGISFCYKNKFDDLKFDSNRNGEDFDLVKKLEVLTNNYIITEEIFYYVRH
jgi:glycosyltransferase involved in cell wall biosynthesis